MSAHSRHTRSGMTPTRISAANALQPRHIANTDSRVAATINSAMKMSDSPSAPVSHATSAAVVTVSPMVCAKRLGGPGTRRAANGSAGHRDLGCEQAERTQLRAR